MQRASTSARGAGTGVADTNADMHKTTKARRILDCIFNGVVGCVRESRRRLAQVVRGG